MSHFAELDANNKVIRVLVCDNNDPNGDEGYQWLIDNLGGVWVKTSYNNKIRFNFAGVCMQYDSVRDAFIPSQCHNEAVLNESNCNWVCTNKEHDVAKL